MWTFTPPFANVDSLALGGILAYAWATESEGPERAGTALRLSSGQAGTARSLRARMAWVGGWIGTPLVIGLSALSVLHLSLGMAHAVFEYTILGHLFRMADRRGGPRIHGDAGPGAGTKAAPVPRANQLRLVRLSPAGDWTRPLVVRSRGCSVIQSSQP